MLLTELASRNLSAAIREASNAAIVIQHRLDLLNREHPESALPLEKNIHHILLEKMDEVVRSLESVQSSVEVLKEF